MSTVAVSSEDIWLMLVSTFRYSMGRSTYMTGVCVDLFTRYASVLTEAQRTQIKNEVRREFEAAELHDGTLGMRCDHDAWRAFVGDAEEHHMHPQEEAEILRFKVRELEAELAPLICNGVEYMAANLRAALDLVPDTGDWHGCLRHWCDQRKGGAEPNISVEEQRVRIAADSTRKANDE